MRWNPGFSLPSAEAVVERPMAVLTAVESWTSVSRVGDLPGIIGLPLVPNQGAKADTCSLHGCCQTSRDGVTANGNRDCSYVKAIFCRCRHTCAAALSQSVKVLLCSSRQLDWQIIPLSQFEVTSAKIQFTRRTSLHRSVSSKNDCVKLFSLFGPQNLFFSTGKQRVA